MEYITHTFAIFGIALLCAGWGMVQFFARYMKTKNHFDHEGEGCGNCAKSNEGPAKLAAKNKVSGEPAPKGCNIPFRDK